MHFKAVIEPQSYEQISLSRFCFGQVFSSHSHFPSIFANSNDSFPAFYSEASRSRRAALASAPRPPLANAQLMLSDFQRGKKDFLSVGIANKPYWHHLRSGIQLIWQLNPRALC
jgi:hypothetical protein